MSASSKYDLSSCSPDRPYASGQRSSYSTASLDRSGSFRESMESPSVSPLSNMTRSSSSATKGDVLSFLQCLRFDPKSMIGDHKLNRSGDFKRLTGVALGIPQEDLPSVSSNCKPMSSPLPEDFRRLKAGLRESCSKARERAKIFSESQSVINKWFPSIPSKKRSRLDALSNDRPKPLLHNDRQVFGLGINKMGFHSHASTGGIDREQHKSEERIKAVPNKRTRTSKLDVRMGTPVRTLINADKDRETLRLPSGNEGQTDSRALPIGINSWEKSKMKKKRSGIKHDIPKNSVATKPGDCLRDIPKNSVATKPNDCLRDLKPGPHQRLSVDTWPRLGDTHGFRSGMVNGGMGVGKSDGIRQESAVLTSVSRTDFDNNMLLHERRNCPAGSNQQRVNGQAINMASASAREDFSSGSPASNTKIKAVTRPARSGSGLVPKLSSVMHRAAASADWEVSQCTNEDPASIGVNNRKHSVSARSSSPPVAQWAGQRPQKISRTARRTNFLPIVPSYDATPPPDATPYVVGSERRLLVNSPQQAKLIGDSLSSLSESEESGAAEIKTKEKKKKKKKTDEIDENAGMYVQKMSTLLPPRKNKVFDGEGQGGGIRKRGRTGRSSASRSLMPLKAEKLGNAGTAKQLRTSRLGLNKNESKGSQPATRKLSDRKPYPRQKHTTMDEAAEFFVSSNDGHEELVLATNGVLKHATEALSSPFWKKVEPYFGYLSDVDFAYLEQQITIRLDMSTITPTPFVSEANTSHVACNGFVPSEVGKFGSSTGVDELMPGHISFARTITEIPLYQRLIAALIPEEGNETVFHNRHESVFLDTCESRFEHEADFEFEALCPQVSLSNGLSCHASSNGHQSNDNGWCFDELNHIFPNPSIIPNTSAVSKFNQAEKGLFSDQQMMPEHHKATCSEEHYNSMSINERLLWEIRSVGICLDQVPYLESTEDDEIEKDIDSLHDKYHKLVSKKRDLLGKLLPSASEARELQEKGYESQALDKLVEMAYEKYMTCRGPNTHGMKSARGKMAKQAALAFVIQSLEKYREFEQTGKSCFGLPEYKDIFISGISRLSDLQSDSMINEYSTEIGAAVPLDVLCSPSPEYDIGKQELWSNKVKTKELSLDDVGGGLNLTSSGAPSGIENSFSSCSKGKRSGRDREGKCGSREVLSIHGTAKNSGSVLTDVKGERKSKTKQKQKTTEQYSSNGPTGKKTDRTNPNVLLVSKSSENASVGKDDLELLDDPIDLSGLQIPEMDDLGVHDDFSGQGEDIGSWLNIDEDGIQEDDFMGLEIPMDDLSDLNMMV